MHVPNALCLFLPSSPLRAANNDIYTFNSRDGVDCDVTYPGQAVSCSESGIHTTPYPSSFHSSGICIIGVYISIIVGYVVSLHTYLTPTPHPGLV